ncbi:ring finger domain protein [Seiridium cupressi]
MASLSLSGLFQRLRVSQTTRTGSPSSLLLRPAACLPTARQFTTTPCPAAKAAPAPKGAKGAKPGKTAKKRKKNQGEGPDPRIRNLKISMPRKVPAPLRFARNRHLRHWTIHRAWLLWQRKEREREENELMRMYQSMASTAEELRKTSGPGTRDEGYLYRVAMEKKGMFGHNAIPIEYAKAQTETPARMAWNHEWTRD